MDADGAQTHPAGKEHSLAQGIRVLVIEPSSQQREEIGQLLQNDGYQIELASCAEEALDLIDRRPPNLVVLELRLPGGHGVDLLREIKSSTDSVRIPVVAVTGIDHPSVVDHCFACGCDDFILKPFSRELLLRRVETALRLVTLQHDGWSAEAGDVASSMLPHSDYPAIDKDREIKEIIKSLDGLERALRGFDEVLFGAVDGIIATDQFGTIRRFNTAASRILGYEAAEVIGKNVSMFIDGVARESHDQYLASYLKTRESTIVGTGREVMARRKDGSRVPIYIAVSEAEIGGKLAFLAIIRDLTRDYESQHVLQKAKQDAEAVMRDKDDFLAHVSHELRVPLHGLLSYSHFGSTEAEAATRETLAEYFKEIRTCGETLLDSVSQLLDLKELEAGTSSFQFTPVSFSDLLEESINEFRSLAFSKQAIITHLPLPEEVKVEADRRRLQLVIRNLLANALRFSPSHGMIWVSLTEHEESVQLTVRDEGPGIAEDEIDSIFEKFARSTSASGTMGKTGPGLAVCRKIVLSHNGSVWAENHAQGGAVFHCQIPKRQPTQDRLTAGEALEDLAPAFNL